MKNKNIPYIILIEMYGSNLLLKSNHKRMFNKNKDVVMAIIVIIWLFIDILSVAISYSLELDAKTVTHIVNMVVIVILWILLIIYLLSPKWIKWCNKEF